MACALVNSTELIHMPYLEPDPISFLEQMINFWVLKPYANLNGPGHPILVQSRHTESKSQM